MSTAELFLKLALGAHLLLNFFDVVEVVVQGKLTWEGVRVGKRDTISSRVMP